MSEQAKQAPNPHAQIIDSLTSGALALDKDNRIVAANPAAARQLRLPEDALRPGARLDGVPGVAPLLAVVHEVARTQKPVSRREIEFVEGDNNTTVIGLSASPLQGSEKYNGAILLFTDLTQVRALERIARVNRQLAEIGEMTAGVVHELRNPLSVISGLCELVLRKLGENPARKHLETILKETSELNRVITRFLGFAKPFELEIRPATPAKVLARAVQLAGKKAAERRVEIRLEGGALEHELRCDAEKLAQALGNIIVNGVELVANDGTGAVAVLVQNRGELVEFRIEDNGPGIHLGPGEDLFSPFFSRREGGTGLGLSIVQRVVAAHQGEVSYGNNDHGGAWFQIRVPLAPTHRPGQVI